MSKYAKKIVLVLNSPEPNSDYNTVLVFGCLGPYPTRTSSSISIRITEYPIPQIN